MTIYTAKHKAWQLTNTQAKIDAIFTPEVRARFWSRVTRGKPDDCWEWTGPRHPQGYGNFSVKNRTHRSNRVSWMLLNGPIPANMHILHRCDNPPCCNPAHLWCGSNTDNYKDRDKKLHFSHGTKSHTNKLTPDQVLDIIASTETSAALARRYGVHASHIGRIRKGQRWQYLEHDPTLQESRD